jgi:hypothetical protein
MVKCTKKQIRRLQESDAGLDDALRRGIDHQESRAAAAAVPGTYSRTRREDGISYCRIRPPAGSSCYRDHGHLTTLRRGFPWRLGRCAPTTALRADVAVVEASSKGTIEGAPMVTVREAYAVGSDADLLLPRHTVWRTQGKAVVLALTLSTTCG